MSDQVTPPDQKQRSSIITDLDNNILVEAAAGTGKTTSLVGRMVALLRTGKCSHVRHMAAVTFTRKAASELRSRFRVSLEQVANTTSDEDQKRIQSAIDNIEHCFIGTIHSFCARILRERPVEAKVDISFEEIDEDTDSNLKKQAWNICIAQLFANDPQNILLELENFNLGIRDLEDAFLTFANFPDVDDWPVSDPNSNIIDFDSVIEKLVAYVEHMQNMGSKLPQNHGTDELIPEYKRLPRFISHFDDLHQPSQLMEVLNQFKSKTFRPTIWTSSEYIDRKQADSEKERWDNFCEQIAIPCLTQWRESRYPIILHLMHKARDIYDQLREQNGQLNYQDLLIKTANLLRKNPHVRKYFSKRYTHLLVDEFQDTDPVQAEVMLLLTSTDPNETDWHKCIPRQGSLFVVGDPKQSIYRFRRADIVTYNEVKKIIGNDDKKDKQGYVLQLSTNFRTTDKIVDWVNEIFAPRFPKPATNESPAYVPIQTGRVDGNIGDLIGVKILKIPKEHSSNRENIVEYEADLIARTIRYAIDKKLTVSRTKKELQEGVSPYVSPSDFMIVTRVTKKLSSYAKKLQQYGIPHQVTGGSALNELEELSLLHTCLEAVIRPDNPVALVATLRSELFGISDQDLYAFKKANGTFSYTTSIPDDLDKRIHENFFESFAKLKKYSNWMDTLPTISAIEQIVSDLGLMVIAAAKEGGDIQAGSLGKAIEILRAKTEQTWSPSEIVDRLGQIAKAEQKFDGISVLSEYKPVVRLMNLHKVKGLEAPVVFLADPSGEQKFDTDLHIDRSGHKVFGYMGIYKKKGLYHKEIIAHPSDWQSMQKKEEAFYEAEALRLRYVAATRSGSQLIFSWRPTRKSSNPWDSFFDNISEVPELIDPGVVAKPLDKTISFEPGLIKQSQQEIEKRVAAIFKQTYNTISAKEYALSDEKLAKAVAVLSKDTFDPTENIHETHETGSQWGLVIHALIQKAFENKNADLLRFAKDLLNANDFDESLANHAVTIVKSVVQSEIGQRAISSSHCLFEVPFQIPLDTKDNFQIPTILRGRIDLVFHDKNGWVLVDFKTDSLENKKLNALAQKYAPQIALYSKVWENCTKEPVIEAGLFFTNANAFVRIED